MPRLTVLSLLATALAVQAQSTPVIGGNCKLGMQDVQIGGKQTQFFLKCEAASDSPEGDGVWVVKSRAASPPASESVQHRPSKKPANPNICEQDNGARESESCAVSAMCLQADVNNPVNYLQCDQTSMRWVKKACQETYIFSFEQQTCTIPRKLSGPSRQQAVSGLVCTFSSCSNSNPCSSGTCNNGYCCSSGSSNSQPTIIVASSGGSSGCNGCNQQQQPIIISTCPGGGYPVGSCSSGYCASGYSCVSGSCCPSYNSAPQISVFTCPSGGSAVGACVSGSCATGYSCVSGSCCPSTTTTNPFVCSDGTQAVGGCVNGQCGTGYTCTNGLCCVGTGTSSVRCLDGSAAVGACIPSCTGNACGQVQVTFYCGAGYTCTTGNICCAINSCPNGGTVLGPTVNGLCPSGYTAQNGICCSALCPDGSAGSPAVNNQCPTTLTLTNGVCCASTNTTPVGQCGGTTNPYSIGPCISGVAGPCGQGNGNQPGYACDATLTQCCPVVDTTNLSAQIGPAVTGMCPVGYTAVFGLATDTTGEGICIDLATTQGLCAAANQIGPCANQVCPAGYTCNIYAEICCATGTATFSRLRPGQRLPQHAPTYGRSLNSFTAPRDMNCPDGSVPASGCMNGLCGVGLECHNGVCCPPQSTTPKLKSQCPNSEFAVSGCFGDGSCGASFECVKHLSLCCPPGGNETPASVKNTIRPIGARCFSDDECVGSDEGLSLCHAGVCQCSPIAYSQGIACVRRMALSKGMANTNHLSEMRSQLA